MSRLEKLELFIRSIEDPISDLSFRQSNAEFCNFCDDNDNIKNASIEEIIKAYMELTK